MQRNKGVEVDQEARSTGNKQMPMHKAPKAEQTGSSATKSTKSDLTKEDHPVQTLLLCCAIMELLFQPLPLLAVRVPEGPVTARKANMPSKQYLPREAGPYRYRAIQSRWYC